MDAGTTAFGGRWCGSNTAAGGPGPYSPRSDRFLDMKNRIHDCMLRSMNGRKLPDVSSELNSMIEYMKWLATGMQVADYTKVVGQGNIKVSDLTRPTDPVRGKTIYLGSWPVIPVRRLIPLPKAHITRGRLHI
jgi:thiosulfate dehydrogenase